MLQGSQVHPGAGRYALTPRLITNPASAGGRHGADLARLARDLGLRHCPTGSADALRQACRDAVRAGDERVLVAGGDGTMRLALEELAGSGSALGVVPAGRGNDFARALRLPRRQEQAARHALAAPIRPVDLGRVAGGALFGCIAGVGFDSEVARFANARSHFLPGPWIYPYAVLRTVLGFQAPRVVIESEHGRFEGRAVLAAFANGPCFGGGMQLAPSASLDDGLLDVVVIADYPRLRLLASVFPRVYRGTHTNHPALRIFCTPAASIRVDREIELYADGEPLRRVGSQTTEIACVAAVARVVSG